MKKLLAILLCLALCLPCVSAFAQEPEREVIRSGDYRYVILEDDTAEITDYFGTAADLVIPETLDGRVVTSIGEKAFDFCGSLSSITIPDSVTSIGDEAFRYCAGLIIPQGASARSELLCSGFHLVLEHCSKHGELDCARLVLESLPDSTKSHEGALRCLYPKIYADTKCDDC